MRRLDPDEINKLISLVSQHPIIYNKYNKNYKKLQDKEKIWVKIAKTIGKHVTDCKIAWKSVRDQFVKIKKSKVKPETRTKRYKHYESLLFLNETLEPRYFKDFVKEFEDERGDSYQSENENSSFNDKVMKNNANMNFESVEMINTNQDSSNSHYLNFQEISENEVEKLQRTSSNIKMKEDEVDKYFLVLSSMVKKCDLSLSDLTHLQCNMLCYLKDELVKLGKIEMR